MCSGECFLHIDGSLGAFLLAIPNSIKIFQNIVNFQAWAHFVARKLCALLSSLSNFVSGSADFLIQVA
jgi:hypothetical protein